MDAGEGQEQRHHVRGSAGQRQDHHMYKGIYVLLYINVYIKSSLMGNYREKLYINIGISFYCKNKPRLNLI